MPLFFYISFFGTSEDTIRRLIKAGKIPCYTINEVSEKYGVSLSTVDNIIRRNSIPKRQVGKFVYVPKIMIDKLLVRK